MFQRGTFRRPDYVTVGAFGDSFFEYLLKGSIYFKIDDEEEMKECGLDIVENKNDGKNNTTNNKIDNNSKKKCVSHDSFENINQPHLYLFFIILLFIKYFFFFFLVGIEILLISWLIFF
jgi:hypothetical protein